MDKQEVRQAEMDARHSDSITWRNTVRAEEKTWRETIRAEDKEWRLTVREEDKSWRESEKNWRQTIRDEDAIFRSQSRVEDKEHRSRSEVLTKRCCALSAAAQSSIPGTLAEDIFALAKRYEEWLDCKRE
jgi:hypothetical protein